MKQKKMSKSPAIQLLDLVWSNTNNATGHSWERLNHAMSRALGLAVGAGFEFEPGDMRHVFDNYRSGRWIGDREWIYRQAVRVGNMSAAKSFEAAVGREPFIADEVSATADWGAAAGFAHGGGDWQRQRLAVGFTFAWRGYRPTVTSFAADQSHVVACTYKATPKSKRLEVPPDRRMIRRRGNGNGMPEGERHSAKREKVERRFRITRDDIIAERAERRERAELIDRAIASGYQVALAKLLGVKTQHELDRLPIAKVRKAVDRCLSLPMP